MVTGPQDWSVLWPYAVLFIVAGVWGTYRFLGPSSWREWAGAGLVQAFIIALYAEMYGFPLTIYFLTGILPLDRPISASSGHLWSTLLGLGPLGAVVETLLAWPFILLGLLLIVKGWVRIYFLGDELVTSGVYGLMRHPQYTGIFLLVAGQLLNWPTIPTLVLSPVIIWLYVDLARREETRLRERFSNAFDRYKWDVPRFIPRWHAIREAF